MAQDIVTGGNVAGAPLPGLTLSSLSLQDEWDNGFDVRWEVVELAAVPAGRKRGEEGEGRWVRGTGKEGWCGFLNLNWWFLWRECAFEPREVGDCPWCEGRDDKDGEGDAEQRVVWCGVIGRVQGQGSSHDANNQILTNKPSNESSKQTTEQQPQVSPPHEPTAQPSAHEAPTAEVSPYPCRLQHAIA